MSEKKLALRELIERKTFRYDRSTYCLKTHAVLQAEFCKLDYILFS